MVTWIWSKLIGHGHRRGSEKEPKFNRFLNFTLFTYCRYSNKIKLNPIKAIQSEEYINKQIFNKLKSDNI